MSMSKRIKTIINIIVSTVLLIFCIYFLVLFNPDKDMVVYADSIKMCKNSFTMYAGDCLEITKEDFLITPSDYSATSSFKCDDNNVKIYKNLIYSDVVGDYNISVVAKSSSKNYISDSFILNVVDKDVSGDSDDVIFTISNICVNLGQTIDISNYISNDINIDEIFFNTYDNLFLYEFDLTAFKVGSFKLEASILVDNKLVSDSMIIKVETNDLAPVIFDSNFMEINYDDKFSLIKYTLNDLDYHNLRAYVSMEGIIEIVEIDFNCVYVKKLNLGEVVLTIYDRISKFSTSVVLKIV